MSHARLGFAEGGDQPARRDARRHDALRRCIPARRPRPVPDHPAAHALRQDCGTGGADDGPHQGRQGRFRTDYPGHTRALYLGRRVLLLRGRHQRRPRHRRVGRIPAVVQWQGRHDRRVLCRRDPVAGSHQLSAAPSRHRTKRHCLQLPRRVDLPGGRLRAGLQHVLDPAATHPG